MCHRRAIGNRIEYDAHKVQIAVISDMIVAGIHILILRCGVLPPGIPVGGNLVPIRIAEQREYFRFISFGRRSEIITVQFYLSARLFQRNNRLPAFMNRYGVICHRSHIRVGRFEGEELRGNLHRLVYSIRQVYGFRKCPYIHFSGEAGSFHILYMGMSQRTEVFKLNLINPYRIALAIHRAGGIIEQAFFRKQLRRVGNRNNNLVPVGIQLYVL